MHPTIEYFLIFFFLFIIFKKNNQERVWWMMILLGFFLNLDNALERLAKVKFLLFI
jgi:hypothetical protein